MRHSFLLALVLCLVHTPALADPNETQAQTLREQAKALGSAGKCTEAIKLFQKAYDINKSARDLYNISSCEFYLQKYANALRTSDLYLSQLALDDEQLLDSTEQLNNLTNKLNVPEVQKSNAIKANALLVRIEQLSTKAQRLAEEKTAKKQPPLTEATPSPETPQAPTTIEAPPKRGLALPRGMAGLATVSIVGLFALEAKTQNSGTTTDARESLRVGFLVGAGLSLAGAGAVLLLRNKKNKPEASARVSLSPRQVALVVSF